MRRLELPITAELAGIKVDTLLKKRLGLSGTVVRRVKWLPEGILLDGVRVNTRVCPVEGQVLSVQLSDPERRSGILPLPANWTSSTRTRISLSSTRPPVCLYTPARAIFPIRWVIFCCIITISRDRSAIFTPFTDWIGAPPDSWWPPNIPTLRKF